MLRLIDINTKILRAWLIFILFSFLFSPKQTTQKNKDKHRVSNKNTYGPNIE